MRLDLLKSIARSLLRTANRRISQYRKLGLKNPDIEDILDTISERPYFNKEKGKLMSGGLSRNELEELIEVERALKKTETANQYIKKVRNFYEKADYPANTDPNMFYRALKRFEAVHGKYYKEWTDHVLETGEIESKGGTLARWFREILDEQLEHEFTQEEVEDLENEEGLEKF